MKQKKDQFVIAYLPDLDHPEAVLSHARPLALMLQKGLILLHISDPRYTSLTPSDAQPRLQALCASLPQATYAALKGNTPDIVHALPDLIGAVVIVAQVSATAPSRSPLHKRRLLADFASCKVAYLTVQEPLRNSQPPRVAFSVDYSKASKEKFVWASYFARFGSSPLTAMHYHYKDEGLRYKCRANLQFLSKLYEGLSIAHQERTIPRAGSYPDCAILKHHAADIDLLVAVTTQEKDFVEYFLGTQEHRTIVNASRLPILFLNPRDDIYVLCD